MSDPTGKSLFQQGLIDTLDQRLNVVDTNLNKKLDKFVYEAKKNLLENNDLRHDADIAHLEANTVDKTVYNSKMTLLDAKDFEQDNRINTLQGLLPSKVDQSVFDATIARLTDTDADHERRIVELETRATGFDNQISQTINAQIRQKIDEAAAKNLLAGLQDTSSALYQDLQGRVTQAAYDAAEASQQAVINQKADKTYVDGKIAPLESANLNWEKRLNAVDQYIRLMLETYQITNVGGNPGVWEYTAAFDPTMVLEKYHFKVAARKPRGEFVIEMEPFAYNTFYGKLEMTLNSGAKTSIKKDAFGVSPVAPYRVVMSPNITRELNNLDFPVTFKLYDSSETEAGVIKTISILAGENNYGALPIMDAPRFNYSSSEYVLVKAYSGYTDNSCNNLTFALEAGSAAATSWSLVGALPAGMSFANGIFTGAPSSSVAIGDFPVVVKGQNASGVNGFQIKFKVIEHPSISYTVSTYTLSKNMEMTPILATLSGLTTHGALTVSATGLVAGMFIDAATGRIYGAPTATAANQSVVVTVTGKNGSSNSATLNFTVLENAPDISYSNAGAVAAPVIYRLNTPIDAINMNLGATSGSITSLTISPTLPAGLSFVTQNSNGAWIGRIQGTPIEPIGETKYTVTATGPGGSDSADLYLSVLPAIPVISYGQTSYEFTKDVAITDVAPSSSGSPTAFALYNLANTDPATLPAGLAFNTATGVISGTPTEVKASTGYSVRATGAGGKSAPVSFYITVKKPVPVVTYATALKSFFRNSTITSFGPLSATNEPTLYSIDKVLPAGLNFNNDTGVVSGKPLVLSAETTYTVVAYNEGGASAAVSFKLCVVEDAPVIAYASADLNKTFTRGVAITPFAPSSTQNHISSYTMTPPVGGLTISTSGVISGTPAGFTRGNITTKVKASGNGGDSNEVTITIKINEPAPVFSYSSSTYVRLVDSALSISPVSGVTNQVDSWQLSSNLAAIGLIVDGGVISGTPNVVGGPITGQVTAVGPDAQTVKNVVIDIDQEIPAGAQNGVLESGANFELKLYSPDNSNTDVAFVKKLSAGNVTADLVYYTTDANGVTTKTSIASKEFISGDYIRFDIARQTQYGTDNRLAVIDEFGLAGEVVLARFVVDPEPVYVAPVPLSRSFTSLAPDTDKNGNDLTNNYGFYKFSFTTGSATSYNMFVKTGDYVDENIINIYEEGTTTNLINGANVVTSNSVSKTIANTLIFNISGANNTSSTPDCTISGFKAHTKYIMIAYSNYNDVEGYNTVDNYDGTDVSISLENGSEVLTLTYEETSTDYLGLPFTVAPVAVSGPRNALTFNFTPTVDSTARVLGSIDNINYYGVLGTDTVVSANTPATITCNLDTNIYRKSYIYIKIGSVELNTGIAQTVNNLPAPTVAPLTVSGTRDATVLSFTSYSLAPYSTLSGVIQVSADGNTWTDSTYGVNVGSGAPITTICNFIAITQTYVRVFNKSRNVAFTSVGTIPAAAPAAAPAYSANTFAINNSINFNGVNYMSISRNETVSDSVNLYLLNGDDTAGTKIGSDSMDGYFVGTGTANYSPQIPFNFTPGSRFAMFVVGTNSRISNIFTV